jgi:transposase
VAVEITRRDMSPGELRETAARSRDAHAARRMLALALVLEGHSREDSAQICGMDRQTLRDWVHRYNAEGIAGLSNRPAPGPEPRLSADQEAAVAEWIESGPDLERDGVVRWRCRDLKERIEARVPGQLSRAHHRQTAGQARLPASVGSSPASRERRCGTGGF